MMTTVRMSAWVASTAYVGGAQVSRLGQNYQAAYWTQGQDPATHSGPPGSETPSRSLNTK